MEDRLPINVNSVGSGDRGCFTDQRDGVLATPGAYRSHIGALVCGQQGHRCKQCKFVPQHGQFVVTDTDIETGRA